MVAQLSDRTDFGFDRTPPQDIAAEESVLGGMLLSKDAIADVVEELKAGDFYRPAHETIYDAILDLYGRGEPADAITVANGLMVEPRVPIPAPSSTVAAATTGSKRAAIITGTTPPTYWLVVSSRAKQAVARTARAMPRPGWG